MQFPAVFLAAFTVILMIQQTTAQTCSEPTKKCKKANGFCIGTSEPCSGEVRTGKKWCKGDKGCRCCIEEEAKVCGDGVEQPACKILGGYCMNKAKPCKGREVYSQYFCSGSSCKCCIPEKDCAGGCEDKAGAACSKEVFGMNFGGVCKDSCKEANEIRLGDCGTNCGCCVPLDIPSGSCDKDLGKACGGNPFGMPYSGTCRANCNADEILMGSCADNSDTNSCGCCGKLEFPGK